MSFRTLAIFVFVINMWTSIQCVCFLWTDGDARGLGFRFWASHSYPGSTRSFKTMPSMRLHLLGGVTWFLCPNMGALTSVKSHGLNTRCWLVEKIFAALWLVGTYWRPPYYFYSSFSLCFSLRLVALFDSRPSRFTWKLKKIAGVECYAISSVWLASVRNLVRWII